VDTHKAVVYHQFFWGLTDYSLNWKSVAIADDTPSKCRNKTFSFYQISLLQISTYTLIVQEKVERNARRSLFLWEIWEALGLLLAATGHRIDFVRVPSAQAMKLGKSKFEKKVSKSKTLLRAHFWSNYVQTFLNDGKITKTILTLCVSPVHKQCN